MTRDLLEDAGEGLDIEDVVTALGCWQEHRAQPVLELDGHLDNHCQQLPQPIFILLLQ